jgi:hypothetical protein
VKTGWAVYHVEVGCTTSSGTIWKAISVGKERHGKCFANCSAPGCEPSSSSMGSATLCTAFTADKSSVDNSQRASSKDNHGAIIGSCHARMETWWLETMHSAWSAGSAGTCATVCSAGTVAAAKRPGTTVHKSNNVIPMITPSGHAKSGRFVRVHDGPSDMRDALHPADVVRLAINWLDRAYTDAGSS